MRIDEDWELTVREPDTQLAAPQIGTVMTPCDSADLYLIFVLNHRFNPSYSPGGMEAQVWSNGQQVESKRNNSELLHHSDETVTWTQRLILKGEESNRFACFRVVNGHSDTWGSFGDDALHLNRNTNLTDLSNYHSQTSVRNSGVTFASNRVSSLVLKAVRGYSAAGDLVFEELDPVVVYSSSE